MSDNFGMRSVSHRHRVQFLCCLGCAEASFNLRVSYRSVFTFTCGLANRLCRRFVIYAILPKIFCFCLRGNLQVRCRGQAGAGVRSCNATNQLIQAPHGTSASLGVSRCGLSSDQPRQRAPEDLFHRPRPRALSADSLPGYLSLQLDLPRLLSNGQSLSSPDRDPQSESLAWYAPA